MAPISADDWILNHKDPEILAKAARLPFAAIGSVSPGRQGTIRIRLGVGLPVGDAVPQVPAGEMVKLVRKLAHASAAAERDRADPEIVLETVEGFPGTVAWLKSERCLVAAWYPLIGRTPFVALVAAAPGRSFPRWQRELVRLTLMQESERAQDAPAPSHGSEAEVLNSVLNRLTIPIAVVDRAGRLVYCNGAARTHFQSSGGLRLGEGRVVSLATEANRRLHLAIRAATNGLNRQSHILLLPGHPEGGGPSREALVVTPISASSGLALLVCANGRQDETMLGLTLSELGLSPTEQRLAARLIRGDCLEDAAEQINVKLSTARSYLRSIFDKTGASRQSQLIALGLSLTPATSVAEAPAIDLSTTPRIEWRRAGPTGPEPTGPEPPARTS